MADIRIKDLPAGAFVAGQDMATDSDAFGTRNVDVQEVIQGVLGDIHNQLLGTFTAGEKIATDSLANGARQIDVQDIIDAYDAAIAAAAHLETVNNGLTENPANNAQLGGALIQNTQVGAAASGFTFDLLADLLQLLADNGIVFDSGAGTMRFIPPGGAPTAGDVLTAQAADGSAQWQAAGAAPVQTASNGLNLDVDDVQLGGALTENTQVGAAASGFTLDLLADIAQLLADNGIVLDSGAGTLRVVPPGGAPLVGDVLTAQAVDGSAQWQTPGAAPVQTASNGLNLAGSDVQMGGNWVASTTIGQVASGAIIDWFSRELNIQADKGSRFEALQGPFTVKSTTSNLTLESGLLCQLIGGTELRIAGGGPGVSAAGQVLTAQNNLGTAKWAVLPGGSYGEYGMNPGPPGTAFTVVTAGTPVQWTGMTTGQTVGASLLTTAGNSMTVGADGGGIYKVTANFSFGGTNNRIVIAQLYLNGVAVADIASRRFVSAGGDVGSMSMTGLIQLVATDVLTIRFDSLINGTTLNIQNSNWTADRISF